MQSLSLMSLFVSDLKLPYNLPATRLLQVFNHFIPSEVVREILRAFLAYPKEHFLALDDKAELNANGTALTLVLTSFVDRG